MDFAKLYDQLSAEAKRALVPALELFRDFERNYLDSKKTKKRAPKATSRPSQSNATSN